MAFYKDAELEEVQKNLPCVGCELNNICKHSGSISPVSNLPEIFEVHYVCTQKEKYSKSQV